MLGWATCHQCVCVRVCVMEGFCVVYNLACGKQSDIPPSTTHKLVLNLMSVQKTFQCDQQVESLKFQHILRYTVYTGQQQQNSLPLNNIRNSIAFQIMFSAAVTHCLCKEMVIYDFCMSQHAAVSPPHEDTHYTNRTVAGVSIKSRKQMAEIIVCQTFCKKPNLKYVVNIILCFTTLTTNNLLI